MAIDNLTDKKHWEDAYVDIDFAKEKKTSEVYKWITHNLPKTISNESSFEVGIFPARFSAIFGDLGYEINGIDRIEAVGTSMKHWLEKENYKVGDLICDDFFTYDYNKKYKVVSSFGFIEHFKNFEEVIKIQADLVADNGYIIIEVPNFKGRIQNVLKKMLDKKNLDVHYVPSMNFNKWEKVLKEHQFEIVAKDYLGSFSFQTYSQKRNFFQKALISFIQKRRFFIKKYILKGVSKHHSPMMIMIAKKV